MRLIDADALLRGIPEDVYAAQTDYAEGLRDMIDDINRAKTVDAAPVVHAHWIYDKEKRLFTCSNCGRGLNVDDEAQAVMARAAEKFCYSCGAKMDERPDNADEKEVDSDG